MILNKNKLLLLANQAKNEGIGSLVAIFNNIENRWYYYVGEFKPINPSSHIHHNNIRGRCVNVILDNEFTYFSGDNAKNELISTEINKIKEENIDFDFPFIWFK